MRTTILVILLSVFAVATEARAEDAPSQLLGQRSDRDAAAEDKAQTYHTLAPSAERKRNNNDLKVGSPSNDDGTSRVEKADHFEESRGERTPDVLERMVPAER